ncbi:hypothetical protein ACU4HD_34735 [Cupriavidus basilensis]
MEQAPVEMEALRGMPAEGAEAVGKAPVQRAGGIDAHQVEPMRGCLDLRQYLRTVRRRCRIGQHALPRVALQQQVGVGLQLGNCLTQLQQPIGKALAIGRRLAGQRDADVGMTAFANQLEGSPWLAAPARPGAPAPG